MNFIETYFMDDLSLCDELIDHYNSIPVEKKNKGHYSKNGKNIVDTDIKDSLDCTLDGQTDVGHKYGNHLDSCISQYIDKYPDCNTCTEWGIVENVRMQYYVPGGGFKIFHTERASKNNDRHLVFMTYLNDIDDGGGTEFKLQKMKVKAEKGKTVIWPSDWTHTHRGIVSPSQEKYIVTGWWSFMM